MSERGFISSMMPANGSRSMQRAIIIDKNCDHFPLINTSGEICICGECGDVICTKCGGCYKARHLEQEVAMQTTYVPRKTRVTYWSTQYFDVGTSFMFVHEAEVLQIGEVISLQIAEVYGKAVITERNSFNQYVARRFQ